MTIETKAEITNIMGWLAANPDELKLRILEMESLFIQREIEIIKEQRQITLDAVDKVGK